MSVYSVLSNAGASVFFDFSASSGDLWQDQPKSVAAGDGDPVGVWVGTGQGSSPADAVRASTDLNRPIFRSDYESSGYPALEFDGSNDLMLIDPAGAPADAAAKWFLCAVDHNSGGNQAIFSRASYRPQQAFFNAATVAVQNFGGSNLVANATFNGRFVYGFAIDPGGTNQNSQICPGLCFSGKLGTASGTGSGNFSMGGYVTNVNNWNGAIHQWMFGSGTLEPRELLEAAEALADTWGCVGGFTRTSGGSSGFTGIRGVTQRLGT